MNVAVFAQRQFTDYRLFCRGVDCFLQMIEKPKLYATSFRGVDALTLRYARQKDIVLKVFFNNEPKLWQEIDVALFLRTHGFLAAMKRVELLATKNSKRLYCYDFQSNELLLISS